ncbi:hypothetical protein ACQJBY_002992 [Aegilops geniculata]
MQILSRSITRSVSRVASALPRCWFPALARGDAPLKALVWAYRNQHLDRLFLEKGTLNWVRQFSIHGVNETKTNNAAEDSVQTLKTSLTEDICYKRIISGSSHRDGAIYKRTAYWEHNYFFDITDRTETRLEPARAYDMPRNMMQIFSMKLAKAPINSGSIQLYGYIAARDEVDLRLNYVFNRSRDDPITVQQGSLIEMNGPKRAILLIFDVLLEFDMRIKNGENEEDDLQLIDGISEFDGLRMSWRPHEVRIGGNCGAVDTSFALVHNSVEATVQVIISKVQTGFDLSLSSTIALLEMNKEFQLFSGNSSESCGLGSFVIAVTWDTLMNLKFKVDHKGRNNNIERNCSFKAKLNGHASHQLNLETASVLVKVTWAVLPA